MNSELGTETDLFTIFHFHEKQNINLFFSFFFVVVEPLNWRLFEMNEKVLFDERHNFVVAQSEINTIDENCLLRCDASS